MTLCLWEPNCPESACGDSTCDVLLDLLSADRLGYGVHACEATAGIKPKSYACMLGCGVSVSPLFLPCFSSRLSGRRSKPPGVSGNSYHVLSTVPMHVYVTNKRALRAQMYSFSYTERYACMYGWRDV